MAKRITVSPETSQEIRDEIGTTTGKARTKLINRIAKRLGFSPITIDAHARKTPKVAASTVSTAPNGKAPEAPDLKLNETPDAMAELLLMQNNLVAWTRRNEDYSIKLHEMAYTINQAIESLETAQTLMSLEEENQDLGTKLKQADDQILRLKDIIDREREAKRRGDNPTTRGD